MDAQSKSVSEVERIKGRIREAKAVGFEILFELTILNSALNSAKQAHTDGYRAGAKDARKEE